MELQEISRETRWTHDVALIYARLEEKDKAFAWLEKAFAARAYDLLYLKVCPEADSLHGDQRFQDPLRRIGLPS